MIVDDCWDIAQEAFKRVKFDVKLEQWDVHGALDLTFFDLFLRCAYERSYRLVIRGLIVGDCTLVEIIGALSLRRDFNVSGALLDICGYTDFSFVDHGYIALLSFANV